MNGRTIYVLLKITFGLALLLLVAGLWYYTMGRKPRVLLSAPIKAKEASATARSLGRDEVLMLVGTKATLYDLAQKKERWSAYLSVPGPATPAPATTTATPSPVAKIPATPAPAAEPAPPEKPDPLIVARVQKRFAKLEKWAGELNAKRTKLKGALQIEAFNEEARKYHAALIEARAEAAPLHAAAARRPSRTVTENEVPGEDYVRFDFEPERVEIATLGESVWVAQGKSATGFNRADGRVVKSVPLGGNVSAMWIGAEEVFVMAAVGEGRDVRIMRIVPGSEPTQQLALTLPPEPRAEDWVEGQPQKPTTPAHRVIFGTSGASLLQLDVRLVEKKLTERQTMTGESGSDLEAADKKTRGGFGDDALAFVTALNKEAERDATGGKEIIDESTYAVTLRRPFAPKVAVATTEVHGRAELFSTASLDLIVAGTELVAFDHANKKLWQAKLTQPIAAKNAFSISDETPPPCLESADRLYFFDKAYLTAFQSQTGQPAWRLPMKGIHKIQLDDAGHLYLTTQPGEIGEFSQLLQIDAKSGRVLWKVAKYDDCFVSGKDLYVTRETQNAEDAVNRVFDPSKAPQCRWKLYKLSTRNGEPQWEWFQTRRPSRVEADHKRVSLLFADELQMLTSLAL